MNKPLIIGLVGIVLVASLLLGVHAYGQQLGQTQNQNNKVNGLQQGTCEYHEQMQEIMATGTYADLVALRQESGKPMMPYITDEASFTELRGNFAQGSGSGAGCGMMGSETGMKMHQGQGLGMKQGHKCPMMDN